MNKGLLGLIVFVTLIGLLLANAFSNNIDDEDLTGFEPPIIIQIDTE